MKIFLFAFILFLSLILGWEFGLGALALLFSLEEGRRGFLFLGVALDFSFYFYLPFFTLVVFCFILISETFQKYLKAENVLSIAMRVAIFTALILFAYFIFIIRDIWPEFGQVFSLAARSGLKMILFALASLVFYTILNPYGPGEISKRA